jgi:hypothetical protein
MDDVVIDEVIAVFAQVRDEIHCEGPENTNDVADAATQE